MDNEDSAKEVIELLAQHERAISRLYATYAQYSIDRELWQQLAYEEELHAKWIISFYENIDGESLILDAKFCPELLWQSIRRIENLILEAKNHSPEEMLQYALAIEGMVLEKDALRVFDNTPPAIMEIISRLEKGTSLHYARLHSKLSSLGKR